jgi:hypothetical protein
VFTSYPGFTVTLHLFGILLFCQDHPTACHALDTNTQEVRDLLQTSLETMSLVSRSSAMTREARKCMIKYLAIYDSLRKFSLPMPPE